MRRYICSLLVAALLLSCNDKLVYSEYKATSGGAWNRDEKMLFSFTPPDTVSRHNIFFTIRNDDNYPYSNLFLIATFNFPDSSSIKDTLEYEMALPDGTWMGKGAGSIKENKLWYKENIIFPFNGVYTLELVQAMRKNGSVSGLETLPGITDVGLEIETGK
jgi:gliding motility-associated lipoprotein GldH